MKTNVKCLQVVLCNLCRNLFLLENDINQFNATVVAGGIQWERNTSRGMVHISVKATAQSINEFTRVSEY